MLIFLQLLAKLMDFSWLNILQKQCFHCQFVKYVLILQFTIKKSIFKIRFWDLGMPNLQNKLNQIFRSNCTKFSENYHPWKHPTMCGISHAKLQQYFLWPLSKHFKNKFFGKIKKRPKKPGIKPTAAFKILVIKMKFIGAKYD